MVRILRVDVVGVSQGSRFTCRARNYQDLLCGEPVLQPWRTAQEPRGTLGPRLATKVGKESPESFFLHQHVLLYSLQVISSNRYFA